MEVGVGSSVSGAPPARRVRRLLRRVARLLPRSGPRNRRTETEISVLFCGERRMRALNRRHRRRDAPTDVLAFPAAAAGFLGDIAICVPYAVREARRRGQPPRREFERLLLHGYLHLSGYDHETDDGEMNALESKLRRRLGIGDSP